MDCIAGSLTFQQLSVHWTSKISKIFTTDTICKHSTWTLVIRYMETVSKQNQMNLTLPLICYIYNLGNTQESPETKIAVVQLGRSSVCGGMMCSAHVAVTCNAYKAIHPSPVPYILSPPVWLHCYAQEHAVKTLWYCEAGAALQVSKFK